jgi:hypothetical protein
MPTLTVYAAAPGTLLASGGEASVGITVTL